LNNNNAAKERTVARGVALTAIPREMGKTIHPQWYKKALIPKITKKRKQ